MIQTTADGAGIHVSDDDNMADFLQVVAVTLAESHSSDHRIDGKHDIVNTTGGNGAFTSGRHPQKYLSFGVVRGMNPGSDNTLTKRCSGNGHADNPHTNLAGLENDDKGFGFTGCGDPSPSD